MAKLTRSLVLAAIGILHVASSNAQHWGFQSYGPEQGLTNLAIVVMVQDQQGFIWASTIGGVFRYDGDRFRKVEIKTGWGYCEYTSSVSRWSDVGGDHGWTVSLDGIRLNKNQWQRRLTFRQSASIASDREKLYLATQVGVRELPLQAKEASASSLISKHSSFAVEAASNGVLWYSCNTALCSKDRSGERVWGKEDGIGPGRWHGITEDLSGRLWVRSQSRQVAILEQGASNFRTVAGTQQLQSGR